MCPTSQDLNSSGRHKVSLQAVHSSGSAGRQPGGSGNRHFFDTLPELLSNGSTGSKGGGSSQCSHTLRGQLRDAKQQAEALRSENDALKVRSRTRQFAFSCIIIVHLCHCLCYCCLHSSAHQTVLNLGQETQLELGKQLMEARSQLKALQAAQHPATTHHAARLDAAGVPTDEGAQSGCFGCLGGKAS